jgi:hypothetical protein
LQSSVGYHASHPSGWSLATRPPPWDAASGGPATAYLSRKAFIHDVSSSSSSLLTLFPIFSSSMSHLAVPCVQLTTHAAISSRRHSCKARHICSSRFPSPCCKARRRSTSARALPHGGTLDSCYPPASRTTEGPPIVSPSRHQPMAAPWHLTTQLRAESELLKTVAY